MEPGRRWQSGRITQPLPRVRTGRGHAQGHHPKASGVGGVFGGGGGSTDAGGCIPGISTGAGTDARGVGATGTPGISLGAATGACAGAGPNACAGADASTGTRPPDSSCLVLVSTAGLAGSWVATATPVDSGSVLGKLLCSSTSQDRVWARAMHAATSSRVVIMANRKLMRTAHRRRIRRPSEARRSFRRSPADAPTHPVRQGAGYLAYSHCGAILLARLILH